MGKRSRQSGADRSRRAAGGLATTRATTLDVAFETRVREGWVEVRLVSRVRTPAELMGPKSILTRDATPGCAGRAGDHRHASETGASASCHSARISALVAKR